MAHTAPAPTTGSPLAGPLASLCLSGIGFAAAPLTPEPALVNTGSTALAAASVGAGVLGFRNSRRREMELDLALVLAGLIGAAGVARVRLKSWTGWFIGTPGRVEIRYSPQAKSDDPKWLPAVVEKVRLNISGSVNVEKHDQRRRRILLRVATSSTEELPDRDRERAERTVRELMGPTAKITSLATTADGAVSRIAVTHENGTRLAAAGYRTRVERTLSAVLPGRWRARWDLQEDTVVFEQRPSFPEILWLEPAPIAADDQAVLDNYDKVAIQFAHDEDGNPVYWRPAIDPNLMVVGAPGTGKTSLEHSVLAQVSRYGWPIWVVDGKQIEFLGFRRGWPNVQMVGTRIEEQVAIIERAWAVMEHRYSLINAGLASESSFTPLMLFVDEFADFRANLKGWYATVKVTGKGGDPAEPPVLEKLRSLARKGRSSRVHLLFATQRPDAEYFGGDMRDNFRMRISMGRLSPQAAMMMFQDHSIGTTVPRGCRGRGTTISDDNRPIEIQTFYMPDPRKVHDPDSQEGQMLTQARPPAEIHEPLVIVPPEPLVDLDSEEGHVFPLVYQDYVDAQWDLRANRPDLNADLAEALSPEEARDQASTLTVLGIGGRTAPTKPGRGITPTPEPSQPETVDEWVGYDDAVDLPVLQLQVGDLIRHPDTEEWVTVNLEPEADMGSDSHVTIVYRDDNDEEGVLSVPADERLDARQPTFDPDLEDVA